MKRIDLKTALACLGASNLVFVGFWDGIEKLKDPYLFRYSHFPLLRHFALVWGSIFILTVVFYLFTVGAASKRRFISLAAAPLMTLLGLFILKHFLRWSLDAIGVSPPPFAAKILFPIGLILLVGAALRPLRARNYYIALILFFSPACLVTASQTLGIIITRGYSKQLEPNASWPAKGHRGPPVLFFLFDEWDPLETEKLGPEILPNMHSLKSRMYFSRKAEMPATMTHTSLPTILTGVRIVGWDVQGPDSFMVWPYQPEGPVAIDSYTNVFGAAASNGYNTGIVGFGFPYCHLFRVNRCFGFPPSVGIYFPRRTSQFLRSQLNWFAISALGAKTCRNWPEMLIGEEMKEIHSLLNDPEIGLKWMHVGLPHAPYLPKADGTPGDYHDNLRAADRFLGNLLNQLQSTGAWEESAIFFISDHPRRGVRTEEVTTIPFFLKLPHQKAGGEIQSHLGPTSTFDLLIALLENRLNSLSDIEQTVRERSSKNQRLVRRIDPVRPKSARLPATAPH